ncbi:hypothetical protein JTE90_014176 [Oedothorax gibbosus]|uniref:IRS-type PTB domain-containing protein n=1 Tax=Oedothorax gibbosus TaxID=931172 RepID=A0AAV6VIS6_9ARAC|nr:hypothetical protein JTE90_014176 [Oedothorax gibbosus]
MGIRQCGLKKHYFVIELLRSSVTRAGELWLETKSDIIAQNMCDVIGNAINTCWKREKFYPLARPRSATSNPISTMRPVAIVQPLTKWLHLLRVEQFLLQWASSDQAGPKDLPAADVAGPSDLPAADVAGPSDPIDYTLPAVFTIKKHVSPRTQGETVDYPAKIRTGDLPHYCYFPGLTVSSRAVVEDVRGGRSYVTVHYRHSKWGKKPAGKVVSVNK